jgi:hypothetical protein
VVVEADLPTPSVKLAIRLIDREGTVHVTELGVVASGV